MAFLGGKPCLGHKAFWDSRHKAYSCSAIQASFPEDWGNATQARAFTKVIHCCNNPVCSLPASQPICRVGTYFFLLLMSSTELDKFSDKL